MGQLRIYSYAIKYARITVLGIPFFMFATGANFLVRAYGSPVFSMVAIIVGAVMNITLDSIFIFVFQMGIGGTAWAIVIRQMISGLMLMRYFTRFKTVSFSWKGFLPRLDAIKIIVLLELTSFIFSFSAIIVQIASNNLLRYYGELSEYGSWIPIIVAGIVAKMNVIFISIILGVVQGSQPINGFNYGAKQFGRVKESVRLVIKISFIISVVTFIGFELFPRQLIELFGSGKEIYFEFAVKYMRIFLIFVVLNALQTAITTFSHLLAKLLKGH